MNRLLVLLFCGAISLPACAQVVQLPSVSTFSVRTSVLVPDSGGAYLGGVNRASQESSSRGVGPLRNRGRAGTVVGSGVMVHATIHDLAELDAAVLEDGRARLAARGIDPDAPPPSPIATSRDIPVASVAAIKLELAAEDARQEAAAEREFLKALAYENEGRTSQARSSYRVAMRKSSGPVKRKAAVRLAALPKANAP